ncbi:SLOG family protein [Azospirillum endophyticum]
MHSTDSPRPAMAHPHPAAVSLDPVQVYRAARAQARAEEQRSRLAAVAQAMRPVLPTPEEDWSEDEVRLQAEEAVQAIAQPFLDHGAVFGQDLDGQLDAERALLPASGMLGALCHALYRQLELADQRIDRLALTLRQQLDEEGLQPASEVGSLRLERLQHQLAQAEAMRDLTRAAAIGAATAYARVTGDVYAHRSSFNQPVPQVTAARVVACDWQEARAARRAAEERRVAEGYQLLVMGGEAVDEQALTAALDRALLQHPDTLVLRTGNRRGVQTLAAQWALEHGVPCVVHVPRWQEGGKAAGFARNSAMVRAARSGAGRMVLVADREDAGSRHLAAAGLREGLRVWCLAERRLLTADDVAFRPAPAQR